MAQEEKKAASAAVVDFTNVKDGGGIFNKKRQLAGDYQAKITSVVDAPSKKDNVMQWLFTITVGTGTYPYYCKHQENQLWKLRNLLIAAGLNVPKAKAKVNPQKVVGRTIAVTLDDDEYDDGDKIHKQSQITATFPLSELDPDASRDDEDEEEEEEEEESPPPRKKKAAPVVEEEEDEEEDEEEEEEEDEPEPPKKKKKRAPVVEEDDDDELEELDIDL